jgi:pimeloyl-ACP methyl ester carboxylesterase
VNYSAERLFAFHRSMLADDGRVDAFVRAIEAVVRPGAVVVDIGTGSGILAMVAARAGARRVVVVGHSYGALVAGRALAGGLAADGVVLLGAPGVGPAGGLPRGAAAVTARNDGDPIALVLPVARVLYGPDPMAVLGRLPTSRRGHGAYWSDPVLLDAVGALVPIHAGLLGKKKPPKVGSAKSPQSQEL